MKTDVRLWYLVHFFLEWEVFQTNVVEKINAYITFNNFLIRKSCYLWNNVETYCTVEQATDTKYGACALHVG